jgi:hypothetical protein
MHCLYLSTSQYNKRLIELNWLRRQEHDLSPYPGRFRPRSTGKSYILVVHTWSQVRCAVKSLHQNWFTTLFFFSCIGILPAVFYDQWKLVVFGYCIDRGILADVGQINFKCIKISYSYIEMCSDAVTYLDTLCINVPR